jgi:hypothetical protein
MPPGAAFGADGAALGPAAFRRLTAARASWFLAPSLLTARKDRKVVMACGPCRRSAWIQALP